VGDFLPALQAIAQEREKIKRQGRSRHSQRRKK
jgi:hypothetical protein